jgi:hypothetical protein
MDCLKVSSEALVRVVLPVLSEFFLKIAMVKQWIYVLREAPGGLLGRSECPRDASPAQSWVLSMDRMWRVREGCVKGEQMAWDESVYISRSPDDGSTKRSIQVGTHGLMGHNAARCVAAAYRSSLPPVDDFPVPPHSTPFPHTGYTTAWPHPCS